MKEGYLSEYFEGVAVKRLSAVEASAERSNQHEFNGVSDLKKMLGIEKKKFKAHFFYLTEDEGSFESAEGSLTWYDARESHLRRSEHRLYFPSTDVSLRFKEKDLLLIGKMKDHSLSVIAVEQGSTLENQILWLFGLQTEITHQFTVRDIEHNQGEKIDFATRFILGELGIKVEETDESYLDILLQRFNGSFPTTIVLSEMARETCKDVDSKAEPDSAIIKWMEQEQLLFTTLERHIVSSRLQEGLTKDRENVDEFLKFSLSVQNRRKSRAGRALENHLEAIFQDHGINYDRDKMTENKSKPDFIFPSIENYHTADFDSSLLTMLGSKSSCKERWRQVLTEAKRIEQKHLFTLEPAISTNQTEEMKDRQLQLVIPKQIHKTFTSEQQSWLLSLQDFIDLVSERQQKAEL